MKYKIIVFILSIMMTPLVLTAQKRIKCVVTTQSGTEITGTVKRYNLNYPITQGFYLHKDKDKIWLYPKSLSKVVVQDSLVYMSLTNRQGEKNLMKVLVDGSPLSLCRVSIRHTGNTPGEGFASYNSNEFYILKDGEAAFVDRKQLLLTPEYYFPNAPLLQETIKATKKKDIVLSIWVKEYNELLANQ